MHYKNRNQHRQAGYFQRLCECRRIVARIKELNLAGVVDEFVQKFYSGRRAFYQLMSKTQFMAFALIAIGLCSRLSLLSKAWAKEYVDCYRLLETWMKTFPKDEARVEEVDYESQLPESIDSILISSLPETSGAQLPTPAHQPAIQSALTPSAEAAGSDLGEVIQRTQLPPSTLATASTLSSSPVPKPSSVRKHKLSSRAPSPEPESLQGENSRDFADAASDPHSNLLDELNTIFGSTPSTPSINPSITKKKEMKALPDLDDIFKSKKKPKAKDMKPPASGTAGVSNNSSPMSSAPSTPGSGFSTKSKSSTGSKSNFDSIFDFGQGSSLGNRAGSGSMPSSPSSGKKVDSLNKLRKDKKEIDDIFGSVKKPKKKSSASEIDSIFGPPKKKKKAP
ncbi:hypothetical protein BGX24_000221 [Mortierella sp. AD032]|nr:hypothetical protein BGX24_000221 [Mortierella sp. AD032]